MGRFFLTVMAGAAEMERSQLRERVQAVMAHKKAKGEYTGGRVRFGWRIGDDGKTYLKGHDSIRDVAVGDQIALSDFKYYLTNLPAPARYKFTLGLARHPDSRETLSENDWDIWVYPPQVDIAPPPDVLITQDLDNRALAALKAGGKVLLTIPPGRVKGDPTLGKVELGFSSIFWNTAWTRRQAPHTLGILCDPQHPMFREFPTDYHSNWQWWYLISRAGAMILDDLPATLRPTVQVIDDWFTARKLGLVFEARLGAGRLMVCSIDLERDLAANPVARQFRHSLLRYMGSKAFNPVNEVSAGQVRGLFTGPSALQRHGARIRSASSAEPGYEPEAALDGNPRTLWHTAWSDGLPDFPHELVLEFQRPVKILGFNALPRQDNNRNGWIKEYSFYVSDDGLTWGKPAASGTFAADGLMKRVELPTPVAARYVRLVALSGHGKGPWASLAELEVLAAE